MQQYGTAEQCSSAIQFFQKVETDLPFETNYDPNGVLMNYSGCFMGQIYDQIFAKETYQASEKIKQ